MIPLLLYSRTMRSTAFAGDRVQYFSRIDALKPIAQDTIYIISSVHLTKVRAESVDS